MEKETDESTNQLSLLPDVPRWGTDRTYKTYPRRKDTDKRSDPFDRMKRPEWLEPAEGQIRIDYD